MTSALSLAQSFRSDRTNLLLAQAFLDQIGDGMDVSVESPEAFEEVVWLNFLKDAYVRDDHLLPLKPDDVGEEFRAFFRATVRKLIAAQTGDGKSGALRYLSKNNANLSRLAVLREIFPDATVIVCVRNPVNPPLGLVGGTPRRRREADDGHDEGEPTGPGHHLPG